MPVTPLSLSPVTFRAGAATCAECEWEIVDEVDEIEFAFATTKHCAGTGHVVTTAAILTATITRDE